MDEWREILSEMSWSFLARKPFLLFSRGISLGTSLKLGFRGNNPFVYFSFYLDRVLCLRFAETMGLPQSSPSPQTDCSGKFVFGFVNPPSTVFMDIWSYDRNLYVTFGWDV